MSIDLWHIQEHAIPASHTRGYARGLQNNYTGGLRLAVKQYTPKKNHNPQHGDLTLIMVHGVGSAKEIYEPLFDDIITRCRWQIRNIWAADAAYVGASYFMNKNIIGDEPNWFDNARDVWQMINYFQELMVPPLVGVGQSMGSTQLIHLSVFHPRLFAGLVLFEPGLGPNGKNKWPRKAKYYPGVIAAKRKDVWPSREAAREALRKSPYYNTFEPRVFERVVQHELQDVEGDTTEVTLTTPKTMEAYMWMRPMPALPGFPEGPDSKFPLSKIQTIEGFGRPEGLTSWGNIPHVYPPLLLIWGGRSELYGERMKVHRADIVDVIGTGVGGGGGKAAGQVEEATVTEAQHAVPMERPTESAEAVAAWLDVKGKLWHDDAEQSKLQAPFDNSRIHKEWLEKISKL